MCRSGKSIPSLSRTSFSVGKACDDVSATGACGPGRGVDARATAFAGAAFDVRCGAGDARGALVVLFVPVRNRIQQVVDRFFFKREQDTAASIRRVTDVIQLRGLYA